MEKDFWVTYKEICRLLFQIDESNIHLLDKLYKLIDENIQSNKKLFIDGNQHALTLFYENIYHSASEIDSFNKLLNDKSTNIIDKKAIKKIIDILTYFIDWHLEMISNYKPEEISDKQAFDFYSTYCSKEMFDCIFNSKESLEQPQETNLQPKPSETILSFQQIALIYVYKGGLITKYDCKSKAKDYGHEVNKPFSGRKLYKWFLYYSIECNRKGDPEETARPKEKLYNKIKLFESVCELLEAPYKTKALSELEILNSIYKERYQ
jgi:hypothetical protein